jgi:hypothetical protein
VEPTVIIRYNEDGSQDIISDVPVRVLCIDERCPGDRVYRYTIDTIGGEAVSALIGSDTIGTRHDGTPAQARAEAIRNGGKPALEIVK